MSHLFSLDADLLGCFKVQGFAEPASSSYSCNNRAEPIGHHDCISRATNISYPELGRELIQWSRDDNTKRLLDRLNSRLTEIQEVRSVPSCTTKVRERSYRILRRRYFGCEEWFTESFCETPQSWPPLIIVPLASSWVASPIVLIKSLELRGSDLWTQFPTQQPPHNQSVEETSTLIS
jgi:hypothetical protein